MGNLSSPVQPAADGRPLVAFDFDGTLSARDSFQDFLRWRAGTLAYGLGMAKLAPAAAVYVFDRDRQALKVATTRVFLRGSAVEEIAGEAERYRADAWSGLMRPDALACWEAWKAKDARLVIVSATPECVLGPFAQALGAERLIGTRLETDAAGRITGRFLGQNCRGPEKVRRLREIFGPDVRLAAAYGDSDGDYEMLDLAGERGLKVFNEVPRRVR